MEQFREDEWEVLRIACVCLCTCLCIQSTRPKQVDFPNILCQSFVDVKESVVYVLVRACVFDPLDLSRSISRTGIQSA